MALTKFQKDLFPSTIGLTGKEAANCHILITPKIMCSLGYTGDYAHQKYSFKRALDRNDIDHIECNQTSMPCDLDKLDEQDKLTMQVYDTLLCMTFKDLRRFAMKAKTTEAENFRLNLLEMMEAFLQQAGCVIDDEKDDLRSDVSDKQADLNKKNQEINIIEKKQVSCTGEGKQENFLSLFELVPDVIYAVRGQQKQIDIRKREHGEPFFKLGHHLNSLSQWYKLVDSLIKRGKCAKLSAAKIQLHKGFTRDDLIHEIMSFNGAFVVMELDHDQKTLDWCLARQAAKCKRVDELLEKGHSTEEPIEID
jgi:hypothetical protein